MQIELLAIFFALCSVALLDELQRQNPTARADLSKIHRSYERLMPVQAAAARARAAREAGEFTPAELLYCRFSAPSCWCCSLILPMQPEALRWRSRFWLKSVQVFLLMLNNCVISSYIGAAWWCFGCYGCYCPCCGWSWFIGWRILSIALVCRKMFWIDLLRGTGEALRAPIPMTAGLLGAEFTVGLNYGKEQYS